MISPIASTPVSALFRLAAIRCNLFHYGDMVDPVAWNDAAIGDSNSALLAMATTERDPHTGEAYRAITASQDLVGTLRTLRGTMQPLGPIIDTVLTQDVAEVRGDLERCVQRVVEFTQRRRRILNLVQEALGQLRLDMKYLMFDLDATRRERDVYKKALDEQA